MGAPRGRVSVIPIVVAVLLLAACSSGDDDQQADRTTTSSTAQATTTSTTSIPTTTAAPQVAGTEEQRLWPRPSSDVRFDDPAVAARSFAVYYAHFDDPVVGDFRAGDARSGEVDVSARGGGPVSTVLVRQGVDDGWYVVASVTPDIVVDQPPAGASLACPLAVSGQGLAFEAQIDVHIDAYLPDGRRVDAGHGFVMGAGTPPAQPFSGQIRCTIPSGVEPWGILSLTTPDMASDSGGILEITALPIRIGH